MTINIEILNKILLGVTLAAPIGPVSLEMIQRGLKSGFLSAFVVRLGAAVGNLLCLLVSYYSIVQLNKNHFVITGLGIIASLLLIHRAYICVTSKIESLTLDTGKTSSNGILTGLYLSIANPIAFIFWSGIMANSSSGFNTGLAFNLLIILGVLIWGVIFSLFLSVGRNYITREILLYVNRIAGVVMMYYGIKFLWKNLTVILF
jgi:threonine/homoserine/homoserine lactone efflux protein